MSDDPPLGRLVCCCQDGDVGCANPVTKKRLFSSLREPQERQPCFRDEFPERLYVCDKHYKRQWRKKARTERGVVGSAPKKDVGPFSANVSSVNKNAAGSGINPASSTSSSSSSIGSLCLMGLQAREFQQKILQQAKEMDVVQTVAPPASQQQQRQAEEAVATLLLCLRHQPGLAQTQAQRLPTAAPAATAPTAATATGSNAVDGRNPGAAPPSAAVARNPSIYSCGKSSGSPFLPLLTSAASGSVMRVPALPLVQRVI